MKYCLFRLMEIEGVLIFAAYITNKSTHNVELIKQKRKCRFSFLLLFDQTAQRKCKTIEKEMKPTITTMVLILFVIIFYKTNKE